MAAKAEVLSGTGTRTSIGTILTAIATMVARLGTGFVEWSQKGQLGPTGRDRARATGARC